MYFYLYEMKGEGSIYDCDGYICLGPVMGAWPYLGLTMELRKPWIAYVIIAEKSEGEQNLNIEDNHHKEDTLTNIQLDYVFSKWN